MAEERVAATGMKGGEKWRAGKWSSRRKAVDRVTILVVFFFLRDESLREDGGRTNFRREITSRFWNSPADTVVKRFIEIKVDNTVRDRDAAKWEYD